MSGIHSLLAVPLARAKQVAVVVRLTPFDVSTPEGRSNERHRRVALTALASAFAKGVNILTSLISVPLTIGYLGTERYGMWMTISSVIALLGFLDLGLGYGLMNAISETHGNDAQELSRKYVSSTFFMLLGISIIMAIVFTIAYPWVSWPRLFNVTSPQAMAEAGPAISVFIACFLVNIPLGTVNRVQLGYQEGFANSLCGGLGNVLGLTGVLLVIHFQGGLPWLVLAMAGAPVWASTINGIALFSKRPWLWPSWQRATGGTARRILRLGTLFFLLQVAVALAYSSDNIVAAQVLGAGAVTQYAVPMRMFSITSLVLDMILSPLWPAYSEAIARGDTAWAEKTLIRSLVTAVSFAGVTSTLLVLFGKQLVRMWVGSAVTPSLLLLIGLGVWTVLAAAGNAVGMFLNAANIMRLQIVCATAMSISALGAKILLAHEIGLPGIIWGTIIAYSIFTATPVAIYVPRILASMRSGNRPPGVVAEPVG